MFTGIIEDLAHIENIEKCAGDIKLTIAVNDLLMDDVKLGDSIAVNGCCLTVISFDHKHFVADVSKETLRFTTLAHAKVGQKVNLEQAMSLSSRFGGHIVSGHVDGVGRIVNRYSEARAIRFEVSLPQKLALYVAAKGSICVDGISLTVNDIEKNCFSLNIVPHTLDMTTAKTWQVSSQVNIEVDVVARYLERLLIKDNADEKAIDHNFLQQHGFFNR